MEYSNQRFLTKVYHQTTGVLDNSSFFTEKFNCKLMGKCLYHDSQCLSGLMSGDSFGVWSLVDVAGRMSCPTTTCSISLQKLFVANFLTERLNILFLCVFIALIKARRCIVILQKPLLIKIHIKFTFS